MQFIRQLLVIVFVFSLSISGLIAQKQLVKAQRQYELKAFDLAIENAKKAIKQDPQCIECHHLIAESFRMMNNNVDAAIWYRKMERFPNLPSDYAFSYGLLLKRMGQYNKAKKYFNEYRIINDKKGAYFAASCDFAVAELSKEKDFELNLFGVSSRSTDFGPTVFKDKIVFSSFRADFKRDLKVTNTSDIQNDQCQFFIAKNNYKSDVNSIDFLRKSSEETYDMGPIHYAANAPICAVTKHNFKDGEKQIFSQDLELSLFLAEVRLDGSFTDIVPFPYNEVGYATGFGTLNPKGNILYYSSNRPGGHGGFDIYVSYFKNGKWTYPANLGPKINTEGNEITPYFDGKTLSYSTDYTTGIGGFDVFTTSVSDGEWKTPVNMGNGVNSPEDDYYFIKHPTSDSYYITSNRLGGRGSHDIYLVHKIKTHDAEIEYTQNESVPRAINLDEDIIVNESAPSTKKVNFSEADPISKATKKIKANNTTVAKDEIEKGTEKIDFNTILPPKAVRIKNANANSISLAGAKRVAYGEIIKSNTNVYFIQLAALYKSSNNLSSFSHLSQYGSLYKVKQSSATKIKLGYFIDQFEAKEILRQVKGRGHSDAFITFESLNTSNLELVSISDNSNYGGSNNYRSTSDESYKIRIASYEDPIWFDVTKVNDIGVIEQWSKGEWTIFVLSGFKSRAEAELARVATINRGFSDATIVIDRNGILEKVN